MRVSEPDNVRTYDQHQMLLFPPSIRSALPDDHLCIVVDDIVNTMDLSCLYIKVASEGNPPYHPAMMLKVLFYAYATGTFSSRKIAKAIRESIPFIYLGAWQQPDFRTISDFRKNNLRELCHLFTQIVQISQHLGMVKLGHVAIDGTKIKANASDSKTYDQERIDRAIKRLLNQAEAKDSEEDNLLGADKTGDELPKDICDQQARIEKLKALKLRLERDDKEKINKTDPEAVFMKTTQGIKTAYNAQAAVDDTYQVIVAAEVTNQPADVDQLLPMVDQTRENTSGSIDKLSADSGYSSGENLKGLESRTIDGYIPDCEYQGRSRKGEAKDPFHKDRFIYDTDRDLFICPHGQELPFSYYQKRTGKNPLRMYRSSACSSCPAFGQCTTNKMGRTISVDRYDKELREMRAKLDSPEGKTTYAKRQCIVEPVFGHIKAGMKFTSFMLRGLFKVNGEFKLVAIAHNLRKIAQFFRKKKENYLDILNNIKTYLAYHKARTHGAVFHQRWP